MLGLIDVETYSAADIKLGAHYYATHPTTEVLCVGLGDVVWVPGEPIPDVPEQLYAWNAEFDRLIYDHILVPRHGWPRRNTNAWDCLMVRAYAANLPGQLDKAAEVLGTTRKDHTGGLLMRQLCKPAPPIKASNDPKRKHTPENLHRLKMYCEVDLAAEAQIAEMLPPLPPQIVELQRVDRRMNGHGVHVDMQLVRAMQSVNERWTRKTLAQFKALTGLDSNRGKGFPEWLEAQGVTHADGSGLIRKNGFDKAAVLDLLEREDLPKAAVKALKLHRELSKTSLAKLNTIVAGVGQDNRLRGMFQLLGAHQTWRYAARRVQLQNLPRGILKPTEIETAIGLALDGDITTLSAMAGGRGGLTEVLSSLLRACFTATPGCMLVDADYSNVEGRLVAWLAGEQWKLRAFTEYDRGAGPDLYLLAYAKAFNVPVADVDKDGRTLGKVMELAGGYAGGAGAFANAAGIYRLTLPDEELLRLRDAWRAANPNVVALWKLLETAAIACVRKRTTFRAGKLKFRPSLQWPKAVEMVLPSGRCLTYHDARITHGEYGPQFTFMGESTEDNGPRKWMQQTSYGGRFLENACQAISFDLMADALVRIERKGFNPVMTVHDELALDVPASRADLALQAMTSIMRDPPAWAEGLPLSAGGWIGYRFRKD